MMKSRHIVTHVEVSVDTRVKLKKLKKDTGAKSIDAVITALLDEQQQHGEADGVKCHNQEGADEPVKRRKIDVRDALYSLEVLTERHGMLEFCTGFDRPAVDLLIRRFFEVSTSSIVFLFCSCSSIRDCSNVFLHPYV
jgi:hypothetical protein